VQERKRRTERGGRYNRSRKYRKERTGQKLEEDAESAN
jgi:hypothetical protein